MKLNGSNFERPPLSATPTAPAAGADWILTATKRTLVKSLSLKITTDANAANRLLHVEVNKGTTGQYIYVAPTTAGYFGNQTAGRTNDYIFGGGLILSDAADQAVRLAPWPQAGVELAPGDIIRTILLNKQVGDTIVPYWQAKEVPD